jgi:hypothetical protein
MTEVAALLPFTSHQGRSEGGRLFPLPVITTIGIQGTSNGK